ncbi:CocE/NonD family hydrolase [Hungatella hathewayi]
MDPNLQKTIVSMKAQYNHVRQKVTEKTEKTTVWIKSSDGIKLKTIIVKPVGIEGPFPTIVQRTCYLQQAELLEIQSQELAKRGFAAVYQWCRGIGESEGEWEPYVHEREDGLPLLEWLQEQEWVKNIGFLGASYLALTGWFLADIAPEKVKTMYLTVLGTEMHTEMWQEGAFRQDIFTSWSMENAGIEVDSDYLESAKYCPQVEVDEKLWGCRLDWYRDEISSPSRLDDFWTKSHWGTLQNIPPRMKMPIFLGEGWYDIHLGNSLKTFENLSETSLANSVLQINPGNHWLQPVIYGQKKQKAAPIYEYEQQLRWFKTILMDDMLPEPSVNYYIIGADEWRSYHSYPPTVKGKKELFLAGRALKESPGEESAREYVYDPKNPVMSHGGATLFKLMDKVGSLEQPKPDFRSDVLSYISDILEADMDIVGEIQAKLWVKSDAPDTCFTIKLMEVEDSGKTYNIRNGITTLGFRNNADSYQSYDRKPVEIIIRCWDIAWRVKKGSKLRVDISSSNFPEYSIHPNTEKIWSLEARPQIAHQTVLSGDRYPSKIILPIDYE